MAAFIIIYLVKSIGFLRTIKTAYIYHMHTLTVMKLIIFTSVQSKRSSSINTKFLWIFEAVDWWVCGGGGDGVEGCRIWGKELI